MDEEFVDLYEVLELPVDADRNILRKRINELYIDAQRNLDHRNFATRVKYQELFEVTMPQARYILLDDGRRDEYNRLVHAYRSTQHGTTPAEPSEPAVTAGFTLEESIDASLPGESPPEIEPVPQNEVDPEQLAREREELWKKWKSGLEEAISVESDTRPKARSATTSAPTSFSIQPEAPTPRKDAPAAAVPAAVPPSQPAAAQPAAKQPAPAKTTARPKVDISFDFSEKEPEKSPSEIAAEANRMAAFANAEHAVASPAEIESRRTEHRRQIMKEVLVNVGLIWGTIGALLVILPGTAALIAVVGHYYPRNATPLLKYSPNLIWGAGFTLIAIITFFVARELSKAMRRKAATQLSYLSYEDLLKKVKKGT